MLTPSRPAQVLGMQRRHRASGEPFMVAVLNEDLHLLAGSELHLRRLHAGNLESPEFCITVVPPQAALSQRERAPAAENRLDASAVRLDARDAGTEAPW